MGRFSPRLRRNGTQVLLAAAAAAALAGCGTPATVKPVTNPLPGFQHDIQAAQNVSNQAQQQAQQYDATGATP
jgi:uncharacterized lipoprotein YajG